MALAQNVPSRYSLAMQTKYKCWYQGLPRIDREKYAREVGTTTRYLEVHLMQRRKCPGRDLMKRLAKHADGMTLNDVLDHFYLDETTS